MAIVGDLEQSLYTVTVENDEFVIRVNRDLIEREELSRILDYLLIQSIKRRSEATAEEIGEVAADVKRAAWQRVQHLFPPVE
jgi:hypothetical protein